MDQVECKTIRLLRHYVENNAEHQQLASTCLKIIEDVRESGLSDMSIGYLHEFIDTVYKYTQLSLLDHVLEDPDCEICRAIASRISAA